MIKSKIHIVYILANINFGGPQKLVFDLVRKLNKERFKVSIIYFYRSDVTIDFSGLKFQGIDLYSLNRCGKSLISDVWYFNKNLYCILNKIKPHIIHSHLWATTCLGLFYSIVRLKRTKWVHTIHTSGGYFVDSGIKNYYAKYSEILITKFSKAITITISKAVDEIAQKYGLKNRYLIHNGVDLNQFSPKEIINNTPQKLIYVARNQPSKGHHYLIDALKILHDQNYHLTLILVGGGLYESYMQHVHRLQLTDFIIFTGAKQNIPELLASADIGVFPSLYEGMPIALCEMMCAGLPIVATDIPPNKEISDNGACMLLVPSKNVEALANALIMYLADIQLRAEMSKKARKRIIQCYSLDKMVNMHESVYYKLIS